MLNFRVEGYGPTIVFLHGFLESISMWDYLPLNQFQGRKILIDLPGHGNSDLNAPFDSPSLQFFVDEVLELLNFLRVDHFSVVGHSMGGYVGLIMKQQIPGCDKVILMNSNFWSDNDQKRKDRVRIADIAFKAKRILINESIPNLFGNPILFQREIEQLKLEAMEMSSEAIAYASLAMRERADFSDEVNSNPNSYFIIHGENDRLVKIDEMIARTKNRTQLYIFHNAGHMSHIESTNDVSEILKKILNPD